jgi:hypothetical protein
MGVPMLVSPQAFDQFIWAKAMIDIGRAVMYDPDITYAGNHAKAAALIYAPVVLDTAEEALRKIMETMDCSKSIFGLSNQVHTVFETSDVLGWAESLVVKQRDIQLKPPNGSYLYCYRTCRHYMGFNNRVYNMDGSRTEVRADRCNLVRMTDMTYDEFITLVEIGGDVKLML